MNIQTNPASGRPPQQQRRTPALLLALLPVLAAGTLLLAAPGCGGSGRSGSGDSLATAGGQAAARRGTLTLTVVWPPVPKDGRLIPAAANAIRATLTGGTNGGANLGSQLLARPAQGSQSTVTFSNLDPGAVTLTATAFPQADGSGVAQAVGSAPATIVSGQAAHVTVTMASTIDHLDVTPPNPTIAVGATVPLTVTARDAQGNVVLVAPQNVHWSSQAAGIASVDAASGVVTGVAVGETHAIVTESESGKNGEAAVTVGAAASPSPSPGGCVQGPVTGPGGLAPSAWPKAGGDLRNSGRALGGSARGELLWHVTTASPGGGSVALAQDDTLYVGSDAGVYALDPSNGDVKWSFATAGSVSVTPAVGTDGTVYFDASGGMYAVDGRTGAQKWGATHDFRFAFNSPTIGVDGTVYMASYNSFAGLLALDAGGNRKWLNSGVGTGDFGAPPAIDADGVLYGGGVASGTGISDGKLHAVDGRCGTDRWSVTVNGQVGGTAIGDDGTIFATLGPGGVVAVDPNTHQVKWTAGSVPADTSPPTIGLDGTVYVVGSSDQLTALDPATGAVKWTNTQPGFGGGNRGAPVVADDGTVYYLYGGDGGTFGGRLVAVDPATGAEKWHFDFPAGSSLGHATPAIGDENTVYVRTFSDGGVWAIH